MVVHVRLIALGNTHDLAGGLGDIRVDAHAVAGHDRRAQRRRLAYDRDAHRLAQHVAQNLTPEVGLGRAAGEDNLVGHVAGGLLDQLHVTVGDQRGVFHDRAVEGVAVVLVRIKVEVHERRAGMAPGDVVHHVGEGTHHAVAAGRNVLRLFVHQVVRIAAGDLGQLLLRRAERIAVPAHDHARLERQRFVLPHARNAVAVHADAAMLVGLGLVGVVLILPEAAAEDGRLTRIHRADAHAAQLAVAAAGHDRGAHSQTGFRRALFGHGRHDGAALIRLGEDAGLQADGSGDGLVPVALFKVVNAGGTGVGRLGGEHARHLVDQPVIEHGDQRGLFVDFRHLVLDPEDARQRAQRIGLAGDVVDLLFELGIHADQLADLVVGAAVDVGAGPDLVAVLVVEDDAFAHTGGGDSGDVLGIHAGLLDDAADTIAGQLPVGRPVKVHAAGEAGILQMRPFLLNAAELLAFQAEKYRAYAAGAGVHGHEGFCHRNHPFQ